MIGGVGLPETGALRFGPSPGRARSRGLRGRDFSSPRKGSRSPVRSVGTDRPARTDRVPARANGYRSSRSLDERGDVYNEVRVRDGSVRAPSRTIYRLTADHETKDRRLRWHLSRDFPAARGLTFDKVVSTETIALSARMPLRWSVQALLRENWTWNSSLHHRVPKQIALGV